VQKEKKSARERAKREDAKAAELGIELPKNVPRVGLPAPIQPPPYAESLYISSKCESLYFVLKFQHTFPQLKIDTQNVTIHQERIYPKVRCAVRSCTAEQHSHGLWARQVIQGGCCSEHTLFLMLLVSQLLSSYHCPQPCLTAASLYEYAGVYRTVLHSWRHRRGASLRD